MRKLIFSILIFVSAWAFCELQTKGFRLSQVLSQLPNRPEWEIPPPSADDRKTLEVRLHQPFFYLGAGDQSVAFLGRDGKTVLKFVKHAESWKVAFSKIPFPSFVASIRSSFRFFRYIDADALFDSFLIAHTYLKKESGMLYLHLNKTEGEWGTVFLHDAIGVQHKVDLDRTEFIVQEYGELIFDKIDAQMKQGKVEEAKASILSFLATVDSYCKKGVQIDNPAIRRNVGFVDSKPILLDIGSFRHSETFKTKEAYRKEVASVTNRLERWLRKHHPSLLPLLQNEINNSCSI